MEKKVKITIYHARQCDPKKCTALKLKRHGLARILNQLKFLPRRAVVLNPFSQIAFSFADRKRIESFGLVGLDYSWNYSEVLLKHVRGTSRCLPFLIAGNPVNFGKPTKLTTAEALAGALYIGRFKEEAVKLLSIFKWGHNFFEINYERLESYRKAKNSTEIIKIQKRFLEREKTVSALM